MRDTVETFRTALADEAQRLGIPLTGEQLDALMAHYALIVKWNARVRLVGTTDPARAAVELFADSLIINRFIERVCADIRSETGRPPRVADIGAGAGLPGVPLKILRPEWVLVAIESSEKKIAFLKTLRRELRLERACVLRGRAEELVREGDFRERFDLALCRAVANPARACELAIPFLKVGGLYLAQTTLRQWPETIRSVADMLGATIVESVAYELSGVSGQRLLVGVEKLRPTPSEYPRPMKHAKKRPLG